MEVVVRLLSGLLFLQKGTGLQVMKGEKYEEKVGYSVAQSLSFAPSYTLNGIFFLVKEKKDYVCYYGTDNEWVSLLGTRVLLLLACVGI